MHMALQRHMEIRTLEEAKIKQEANAAIEILKYTAYNQVFEYIHWLEYSYVWWATITKNAYEEDLKIFILKKGDSARKALVKIKLI